MYLSTVFVAVGWIFSGATTNPLPTSQSHALTSVLSKLTDYYRSSPNVTEGLFNQSISPWWESGSIFNASLFRLRVSLLTNI